MNQFKLKHQLSESITTHRFTLEVNDAYVTGEVILSVSPLDAIPFDIEVAFDSVRHLTQDEKVASELYVGQAIKDYYTKPETDKPTSIEPHKDGELAVVARTKDTSYAYKDGQLIKMA